MRGLEIDSIFWRYGSRSECCHSVDVREAAKV
jgi:hypothetical protein